MARADAQHEVSEWVEQTCTSCGLLYPQRKHYEKKCPVCFKLDKGYELLWGDMALLWCQQKIVSLQADVYLKEKALVEREKKLLQAQAKVQKLESDLKGAETLKPGSIPVMSLLRLCHPDKHGGSAESTEVTKTLLSMRKKP